MSSVAPWSEMSDLEQVIAANRDRVYDLALRIVRDRSAAEDVAQETFLTLLRKGGSRPADIPLDAWLARVTYRNALMALRAQRRRRARESTVASAAIGVETDNIAPDTALLHRAIADLPTELQAPLVLHYLHGLSQPLVATALDIPVGTAGSRIARGVERLRAALGREAVHGFGVAAISFESVLAKMPIAEAPPAVGSSGAMAALANQAAPIASLSAGIVATSLASVAVLAGVLLVTFAVRGGDVAVPVVAQQDAPQAAIAIPANAGAADNGLKLVIAHPPETWYVVGDHMSLPMAFENISDAPLSIAIDSCCSFYDHVQCVDEQGNPCPASQARSRRRHLGEQWHTVPAHGSWTMPYHLLSHWVFIAKPSRYTVWCSLTHKPRKQEDIDRRFASRKPNDPVWSGSITSNPETILVISHEEYAERCRAPIVGHDLDGLSLGLTAASPLVDADADAQLTVQLTNTGTTRIEVPWRMHGVIKRILQDGTTVDATSTWNDSETAKEVIAIEPGQTVSRQVELMGEHLHSAVLGPTRYFAQFWLRKAVSEPTDEPATQPIRTISAEVEITYACTPRALDRLLKLAAIDRKNRVRPDASTPMQMLAAYLDAFAPWLPERARGAGDEATIATDFLLTIALREYMKTGEGSNSIRLELNENGVHCIVPREIETLLAPDKRDADTLSAAFVRIMRCGQMPIIVPQPGVRSEIVQEFAGAIYDTAKREDVYIYRVMAKTSDGLIAFSGTGSSVHVAVAGTFSLPDVASNMLVAIDGAQTRVLRHQQGAGDTFEGWKVGEMSQAIAAAMSSTDHFRTSQELAAHLSTIPMRHEQVLLLPSPTTSWAEICETIKVLRAWRKNVSLSFALRR
jgi:RNA polymerase sigma factor (sigma-70 family)